MYKGISKVSNLVSKNTGRAIPNQFVIYGNGKRIFQSYDSIIAVYEIEAETLTLGYDWDYSQTTLKYLEQFIYDYTKYPKMNKKDIEQAIMDNVFLYDDELI